MADAKPVDVTGSSSTAVPTSGKLHARRVGECHSLLCSGGFRCRGGIVNCMPVFIASNPEWAKKFQVAGIPIVGDDIKSQIGATIVPCSHSALQGPGLHHGQDFQLNIGGNTDF